MPNLKPHRPHPVTGESVLCNSGPREWGRNMAPEGWVVGVLGDKAMLRIIMDHGRYSVQIANHSKIVITIGQ